VDNGIPILIWFDDPEDHELLDLIPFLDTLSQASDVRPLLRERYKMFELIENAS
jgi:CTD small phosphatase-like protein 2